jgi:predicted alpha/beta-hydrolase family hydrolase
VSVEPTGFSWPDGEVSGAIHRPASARRATLVWAHGAGGNMDGPFVVGVAEGLAERGVEVVRFNFLYSEQRRKAPDRGPKLEACYLAVAGTVAKDADRLYLGGGSMGGRIASQIVAGGFPAAGLAFQSYPLHPPGKPERLRDEHLYGISVPMLFVSGTKDDFASGDLLDRVVAKLPTATLHRIEGASHGLRAKGRKPAEVLAEVVDTIDDWIV